MCKRPSTRHRVTATAATVACILAASCSSVAFEGDAIPAEPGFARVATPTSTVPATTSTVAPPSIERLSGSVTILVGCAESSELDCAREPAAGATVVVLADDATVFLTLVADDAGLFRTTVPVGDYEITVQADPATFEVAAPTPVSLTDGPADVALEVSLAPPAS